MGDPQRRIRRIVFVAALLFSSVIPRVLHRRDRAATGIPEANDGDPTHWNSITWEPYKIAIGAFYALCVQRLFDTCIDHFNANPPDVDLQHWPVTIDFGESGNLLLIQTCAILIWIGLYHLNNVRLYFGISDVAHFRRHLTHITLTVALGLFYFLASTSGRPSSNQLLIILGIVAVDAIFPLIIGDVLELRFRKVWFVRGVLQSAFVLGVLILVPESQYTDRVWSVALLVLMLVQLLVLAPLDSLMQRRRRESAQPQRP